jgi:PAS domain S-box-containing protein
MENYKEATMDVTMALTMPALSTSEILESLPDGAYITDLNRQIIYWNAAAERITGWDRADVLGRYCGDNILCHVDKDGHLLCGKEYCPLYRSMMTCKASESPLLLFARGKDGHRVPVEVSVAPVRNGSGEAIGGIEIFRDMTPAMDDLRRAQIIQQHALSPKNIREGRLQIAVRYTPQDIVGGDFYRFEQTRDGRTVLFLADVMGHGTAAALYTMQLRALWEECRTRWHNPAECLHELSTRLGFLARDDDCFATAIHLVLDASGGLLTFSNAGHPPPMIIHRSGRTQLLANRGPALGLLEPEDILYTNEHGQLESGDDLLLYTDGAIETTDADQRMMGVGGLAGLVSRQKRSGSKINLALVEEELLRFSDGLRLGDDLTMLLASVEP